MNKIQVYVANLPGRTARRNSIETEFEGRPCSSCNRFFNHRG